MDDINLYEINTNEYNQEEEETAIGSAGAAENQADEGSLVEAATADPEQMSDEIQDNQEIVDLLNQINDNLEDIKNNDIRNMETLSKSDSDSSDNGSSESDNSVEYLTLSEDSILTKPINEYSVSESMLLFISLSLFIGGLVILVKKGLPKWR